MWPKNATIYGISPKAQFPIEQLQAARFIPVTDLQLQSVGFSPVRGDELAYRQGKHTLLRFTVEKKHIPGSAVAVKLEEACAELEKQQGFPPGKKARKDLKERVIDELLPRALSTRRTTLVWIDQDQHRIVIDSTSDAACDEIVRTLIKLFGENDNMRLQDVRWPRAGVLTQWLGDEPPSSFTVDDAVALQYPGEKGKLVKFERANLDTPDVQTHLAGGAYVSAMAMTFNSRLSFNMTDNMRIRRIKALDIVQEGREAEKDVDRFDSDVALMTRELGCLIDALVGEA
jgi:recombination associated protein RdgC